MNKNQNLRKELLRTNWMALYSLFPMILGFVFIFISMYLYPDYNIVYFYVSMLGIGPQPSAQLFNVGIIITGAASTQFFGYLGKLLKSKGIDEIIRKITLKISLFGGLSLSMVGCFPMLDIFNLLHIFFASRFFISSMIYFILFSYLMLKNENFTTYQAILGFVVAGIFAVYIFTGLPFAEWLVVFASLTWLFLNALLLLIKNLQILYNTTLFT